jgi:ferredoxin
MQVVLFYFSGTGNTRLLTEKLQEELENMEAVVYSYAIDIYLKKEMDLNCEEIDLIGIGYPVHAMNMPDIVADFLQNAYMISGKKVFLYEVAGSPSKINNPGLGKGKKLLKYHGCEVVYQRHFAMGSNLFIEYDKELIKKLYEVNTEKVEQMARELLAGKKRLVKVNSVKQAFFDFIHHIEENVGGRTFGRHLHTNDRCIKCGKCVENCPAENIRITDDHVHFGKNCMWCMRCMAICPVDAIDPGFMKRAKAPTGFHTEEIIADESIDTAGLKLETSMEKQFKKYIENMDV